MSKCLSILPALLLATAASAEIGLGRPATDAEIAAWNIDIRPDGAGLPDGGGDVATGEELFTDLCVACHGDFGEGVGRYPALAGGNGTLTDARPTKTVGSYWPHLSTVYDYIRRAQPFGSPGILTDDEIYSLTAYILYLNDLAEFDFELTAKNFTSIELPNAQNFLPDGRNNEPRPEICMSECGPMRTIGKRASDLQLGNQ